jgi:hypothetical protein
VTGRRVACVVVLWDPQRSAATVERLRSTFGSELVLVAVANSDAVRDVAAQADVVVAGTNLDAEFSGYDEGLAVLRHRRIEAGALLLANDRAFSYEDVWSAGHVDRLLRCVEKNAVALGHIDALPRRMTVLGTGVHAYVRSNLIALPWAAVADDFTVTSIDAAGFDALVPLEYPGGWDLGELASTEYASFLGDWLTRVTGPDHWHAARPLGPDSWPHLRAKVKSIVNEHLLSARLEQDRGLELLSLRSGHLPLVGTRPGRALARALRPDRTQRWQRRTSR